ncbi:MAG: alpha-2-macroglobulin family protein [Saprospiraceae bacterium]
MTDPDYPTEWQLIDSLINQGLYQSALTQITELNQRAQQDNKKAQVIKTLIFNTALQAELSETPFLTISAELEKELDAANGTQKALLEFMLAEIYQQYLNENYWKMRDRTDLENQQDEDDWRNLTAGQLQSRIFSLYENALQEESLKTTPADDYKVLWTNPNVESTLRPTLFDILAHKVIDYLKDSRSYLSEPRYDFGLEASNYFADLKDFAQLDLGDINETSAMKLKALLIIQELAQFRLEQNNQAALIDLDLNRLEFLYVNTPIENKEKLYKAALERLAKQYQYTEGSSYIHLKIIELIYQQGNNYSRKNSPDSIRWKLKEAEELGKTLIKKLPKSSGAKQAQILIDKINIPELKVISEQVVIPNEAILAKITYRNLKVVYFKIIPLSLEVEKALPNDRKNPRLASILKKKAIRQWAIKLPAEGDHQSNSVETIIKSLDFGRYALVFSNDSNFNTEPGNLTQLYTFGVSKLAYFNRSNENGLSQFILMDRESGQPIKDVEGTFYDHRYGRRDQQNLKIIGKAKSDERGIMQSQGEQTSFIAKFEKGEDVLFMNESFYNGSNYQENRTYKRTTFFLDRAIYRPGQIIYFKGIITRHFQEDNSVQILPNQTVKVIFRDANYQEVSSKTFQTNAYGTFNGSFEAPASGLTGYMSLESDQSGSVSFSVEEYKRPKFKVKLEDLAGDYTVNEEVSVKGQAQAFAGNAIDGAKVNYRVTRSDMQPFPWMRGYSYPSYGFQNNIEIANGFTQTDAEGNFDINFTALPNLEIPAENQPRFRYRIEVDVVDITGETQSTNATVIIAYTGMVAKIDFSKEIDRSGDPLEIKLDIENHNGSPLDAIGSVKIIKLNSPNRIYKKRYWDAPDQQIISERNFTRAFPDYAYKGENLPQSWSKEEEPAWSVDFNTQEARKITLNTTDLAVGIYDLELQTKDRASNNITFSKRFMVYDTENKAIPKHLSFWSKLKTTNTEPGEIAELVFASQSEEKRPLFLEMERKGEIIRSEWIEIDQWESIDYKVQEADRGNIQFQYGLVQKNRAQTGIENIIVPFTNKVLQFTYSTFRDKLRPGQEEEWIIKITGSEKEAVAAEMAATLYDASLDQFANHQWNLDLYSRFYRARFPWRTRLFNSRSETAPSPYIGYNFFGPGSRNYPNLQLMSANPYASRYKQMSRRSMASESAPVTYAADESVPRSAAPPPPPPPTAEPEADEVFMMTKAQDSTAGEANEQNNEPDLAPVQIRKDLDETVFFFPDLYTDEAGNVLLKFKMKEALTKWKFLGVAHTKDLKIGLTEKEIVTQKELMVLPNAPRFVREGDVFEFTAKVSNLTDQSLSGTAQIEFLDPINQKSVNQQLGIENPKIDFTAAAGQTARLAWGINIPFGSLTGLTYRVIAQTEQFSDGEENTIPVLTNRTLVTETMPMTVRAKKTKTFEFEAFQKTSQSATATPHLFQLSFTSNPAWMAVQSLPYLMEYPYECSEQLFNRLYANTLSAHVLNAHPSIKGVFDSWKGPDAMKSELEKQQALKTVLLEETPWVMDAQNEATQKAQIALLFDLDRLADEQQAALDKLIARQSSDGGFAWFGGGNNNPYITNYLIAGFGHLHSLGALDLKDNNQINSMVNKAIAFADEDFVNRYERLLQKVEEKKANLTDNHLSPGIIQYLYARSFFSKNPMSEEAQTALDFYKKQAQQYWTKTGLQQQAQLGLIGDRMEIENLSAAILASLKERALQSDELGMYWKYNTGYYWYQAPIETHALMIEFFDQMGETTLVDELKIWLLKNKQTNAWHTTKATAEAVWALLQTTKGGNLLLQDQLVEVQFPGWKKRNYEPKIEAAQAKAEAGTGQFEVNWKTTEVKPALAKIKVKNKNNIVSWGAAYWQYFEDLDKVQTFKDTPLQLEKRIYKQVNTAKGQELQAITPISTLQAGDLLKVRIELKVDRDMEFVHLKDMRASGLEPLNVISGYRWQAGLGYYESTKDLATHFFMDYLPKGTYIFEYPLRVQLNGDFSNGISVIQSMYAPEFTSHSKGQRIKVGKE